jgi:hypothetical protein
LADAIDSSASFAMDLSAKVLAAEAAVLSSILEAAAMHSASDAVAMVAAAEVVASDHILGRPTNLQNKSLHLLLEPARK